MAMKFPSGLHAASLIPPTPFTSMTRCSRRDSTSKTAMRLSPSWNAMNASRRPSGDHEPEALTKLSASKCGSALGPVSFLTTSPVFASAMNRSTVKSPRRPKKATHLPSWLSAGARFISPGSLRLPMSVWPTLSGRARPSISGMYVVRIDVNHSFESESLEMPITRRSAASQPPRNDARYTSLTV
jgi:hypothetical protein